MRLGLTFIAIVSVLLLAAGAGAAVVGIYRAGMDSQAQRAEVGNLYGERCRRGGSDRAFRVLIGKRTRECAYRTPVVGRDLEIAAVGRLLSGTPKPVRRKAFLALNLRAGENGARYQLTVFPLQRKAQLRKVLPDGKVRFLHVERRVSTVRGTNRANELRLRAFNVTGGRKKGNCRVVAFVGKKRVAAVTDPAAGFLQGRASGFSVGSAGRAKGTMASFEDVVIRVPSPF